MRNKNILYMILLITGIVFIIIDKFILILHYGWIEIICFIISLMFIILSAIKLYQLLNVSKIVKRIISIISIVIIVWFSLVSTDYKRHRNMYNPIFTISRNLLTTYGIRVNNGLGYTIIQEYDFNTKTDREYKSKSSFYLFGKKINEVIK